MDNRGLGMICWSLRLQLLVRTIVSSPDHSDYPSGTVPLAKPATYLFPRNSDLVIVSEPSRIGKPKKEDNRAAAADIAVFPSLAGGAHDDNLDIHVKA